MPRIVTVKSVQIGYRIGHVRSNAEERRSIGDGIFENSAGRDCFCPRGRSFRAIPDVGGSGLEASGAGPRHRSAEDRRTLRAAAGKRAVSRHQGRAGRQIRSSRPQPARYLHAGDGFTRAAGADLRPWRRVRGRQQADNTDQPVLRQHHAVGGKKRLCRRQRHLSTRSASVVAIPRASI